MRHLFRTACDIAGISELYINSFMGHTNHQGQDYSELSKAKLELEYLRVEPFLTVYGEVEESLEVKEDVKKLERSIIDLNKEVVILKSKQREWERFSERFFGLGLEILTELEEEPPTSQKMIKISGEKKEEVPLIKTEETVVEPSIETIQEKTPEIKEVETNDLIGKTCPECGSRSLKNGSCSECGYHE
jgi:hypothetical protein